MVLKLGALMVTALIIWLAPNAGREPTAAAAFSSHHPPAASSQPSVMASAAFKLYVPIVSRQEPPPPPGSLPPIYWDPRLGPGGLSGLENVRIIPATVGHSQKFWRVVSVVFQDWYESGNDHTIYVKTVDEYGNRLTGKQAHFTGAFSGISEYPSEKPAGDLCDCNYDFPMFGDAYAAEIVADGYPSDQMAGMIMPENRHVNYRITFQRATWP